MPRHAEYLATVDQAMSIKVNNLIYELKAEGKDIIVLSLGEAFFDIPLFPFDDIPYPDLYHYSHSRGTPGLRRKLAEYYFRRYHITVAHESEILVTAGSKIAVHMAFMALLDPGDEVIIQEPAWVSYAEQVKLCHGGAVMVPYSVPTNELERYVTSRTRAVVLNHPHNPSGRTLAGAELQYLHELADRFDFYLISDEAYSDFLPEGEEFVSCLDMDPSKQHTIVCNSMSKNYGMSGWRIGYALSNERMINDLLKINQHLVTCPATILEFYLEKHFDEILAVTKPQIADVVAKRADVCRYLDDVGLSYAPGTATFYLFVSIEPSTLGSEAFCDRLLRQYSVCVVPGIGYGASCDRFVRLSVGTEPMDRTLRGVDCLRQLIKETAATGD